MAEDDDLWPPFGPAAALRQGGRRPGSPPGGGRAGPAQRGRNRRGPALSRAEIVDAAIAVADAEGIEAVSMRKIAQVLRAGAMSLYWHVAGKEHLLELMLDALVAEVDVPQPTGDWRADLRAQARSSRAVWLRHRWVIDVIGARPAFGPNTLRNTDRSLAALDSLNVDTATAVNILQAVHTYVMGAVLGEFQEIREQGEQEQLGIGELAFRAGMAIWRQKLEATGQFDHFLRILNDNVDPDAEATRDQRFEFGLDCLLDGIGARLAELPGGTAP